MRAFLCFKMFDKTPKFNGSHKTKNPESSSVCTLHYSSLDSVCLATVSLSFPPSFRGGVF